MRRNRVVVAQITPILGDVEKNIELHAKIIKEYSHADLIVFPELSLTGYLLRDLVSEVALTVKDSLFEKFAKNVRGQDVVAGFVYKSPTHKYYNALGYFRGGELLHLHRKTYLPTYGLFDEMRYFARGKHISTFKSFVGRCGMLICEDAWHPSTMYIQAMKGMEYSIVSSASPMTGFSDEGHESNARYWNRLLETYAATYGVYIIYANRVGFEDGVAFWGGSAVIDPFGTVIARAQNHEEDIISAEVCTDVVVRKRLVSPLLRDEDLDLTIRELKSINPDQLI